jgi:protein TonB
MEKKKSKKADLETKKTFFLEIGLIFALAFVLLAFTYKAYDRSNSSGLPVHLDNIVEEMVPLTTPKVVPPLPLSPRQVTLINIVDNLVDVDKDFTIDMGGNQSTEVPDFAPIIQRVEERIPEPEMFAKVEIKPSFPGGEATLLKYLRDNIKYPEMARQSNIHGTVYVSFVIERDGSVSNVNIARGIGGGCDEEAIRVIQNMPDWAPGKQLDKPVRVKFTIPIKFTLKD